MKLSYWLLLAIVCILGGFYAYFVTANSVQESDQVQIQTLLTDAKAAIEQKNIRRVMSYVSRNYHDHYGLNYDSLKLQVVQALRTEDNYQIVLENTLIETAKETATVRTRVTVLLGSATNGGLEPVFKKDVTLHLQKEKAKRFLILPSMAWRVTSISGLPNEFVE